MIQSKEWNWNEVTDPIWLQPSEDSIYLAMRWDKEGAKTILDLGCGLGRHAIYFSQAGFSVTAVDLSADAVNFLKEKIHEECLSCNCFVADMINLPFEANSFDRVFSYHVISHQDTKGVSKIMSEITRVLKPGGKVFLTLCSKEHEAFKNKAYPHIDENTIIKTEGAEVNVPHFFADKNILRSLFHEYTFQQVRHITDCNMMDDSGTERSHYYIEAVLNI